MRAYREFEERVGTIEYGRGNKGDRVRSEVLKTHVAIFHIGGDRRNLSRCEQRHGTTSTALIKNKCVAKKNN